MSRQQKIARLRELARQFRDRASETKMTDYIELMLRAATELEEYAKRLEARIAARVTKK